MDFFKMLQRNDSKAILARFVDPDQARRAKAILSANGITEVEIDDLSEPSKTTIEEPFPATLSNADTDDDRILDAATSTFTGLSADELVKPKTLLTVVAEKENYHRALAILREFDAEI